MLNIHSDLFSIYVCDPARYVESSSAWTFEDIEPGDLLYELGIREGDENATVQGVELGTTTTTTSVFELDSIGSVHEAYTGLLEANGVKLTVERAGATSGKFVIWITIDEGRGGARSGSGRPAR